MKDKTTIQIKETEFLWNKTTTMRNGNPIKIKKRTSFIEGFQFLLFGLECSSEKGSPTFFEDTYAVVQHCSLLGI